LNIKAVVETAIYVDDLQGSRKHAAGWIGFHWGKAPEELRRSKTISDALTLGWLELFEWKAKALKR
jgi:hypothetical protein